MTEPDPGHFWKTPFVWEPGCPVPDDTHRLAFEPVGEGWLLPAVAEVMASSTDESDRHAVGAAGATAAAAELLGLVPGYFGRREGWWRLGRDAEGRAVGFVLPVVFTDEGPRDLGRPGGSILYLGVLPAFRGSGYSRELLDEATRVLVGAGCRQILCDMSSRNRPMIDAFRAAGYTQLEPWQRPIA